MLFFVAVICPSCQRPRNPRDIVMHEGFEQCVNCEHRHEEALQALTTGIPPKECSECNTPWEELRARGEIKMFLHMENGRYRMMCAACDAIYIPKRRELYGPTEFGHVNKLN